MKFIDILNEVAALAGYSISGSTGQDVINKARAARRVNGIRADIISRFSGKWQGQYREGWLPLVAVYSTGTVAVTVDSRTVTGTNTVWTSAMVGRKFLGPDSMYYKIANVASATSLTLTEPYQSASVVSGGSYQIWKDEYCLYPEAFSIVDFINYIDPSQMREETIKKGRLLNPRNTANETPRSFSVLGRKRNLSSYSTGTITGTINTRTLTGIGTSWVGNIQPGYEITIGSYTYHVDTVDSDTQLTLVEDLVVAVSGTAYSARGRNALIIRFLAPSSQTIANYGYYSKIYNLVNDNDEDWLLELYPHLVINGVLKWDYMDKNDPIRANEATQMYENDLHNAQVADSGQFGGTSSVGLDIPDSARL